MKQFFTRGAWAAACLALLTVAPTPASQDIQKSSRSDSSLEVLANNGCSNQTLRGRWALSFTGELLGPVAGFLAGPLSVVAVLDSSGNGSFTGKGTANVSGFSAAQSGVGTYTVNSDCTGTATFDYGVWELDLSFVIHGQGRQTEVWFVNTNQPAVVHGTAKKM